MTGPVVAVLAGRGKTGRAVAAALARCGVEVRLVGREIDEGAALEGVQSMYLVAPNMCGHEPRYVEDALRAAVAAGVRRVVYHSVAAPYAPDMPHHVGKARAEDVVRRGAIPWTILQPCAYQQNFVPGLRGATPSVRVPYDPARTFGLVDLDDVAEAAAGVLLDDAHVGATYELGGPTLLSAADVARTASLVLGVEVPVEHISVEEWTQTLGAGLRSRERLWLGRMFTYYDRYGLPAGALALRGVLGRAPHDLVTALRRELTSDDR